MQMNENKVDLYIRDAVEFLRKFKANEIKMFSLLYSIFYCKTYINLDLFTGSTIKPDMRKIKEESKKKLNADIFKQIDTNSPVAIEIINWLKNNPPIETEEDVLGTIYLLCSEKSKRKRLGEHYTRIDLVNLIFDTDTYEVSGLRNLTMIDPACGSGNFLVVYLRRIFQEVQRDTAESDTVLEKLYSRELISGVDLQEIPVLIAKIRLLMLIVNFFKKIEPKRILPIFQLDSLLNEESSILEENQYDIVATNPPYLSYQAIDINLRNELSTKYSTAIGKFDLYTIFIEKSISLAKEENGKVIVLCSDKFTTAAYGKPIRHYINECAQLKQVFDLNTIFPFKATVLSAVYFFEKTILKEDSDPILQEVIFSEQGLSLISKGIIKKGATWRSINLATEKVYKKVLKLRNVKELQEISKSILVGIQTTADSVFCRDLTNEFVKELRLERELIHPLIRGRNLVKWGYRWSGNKKGSDTNILYPYIEKNAQTVRINLKDFPNVSKYLKEHKELLGNRPYIREKTTKEWFDLWVERSHETFRRIKILTPDLSSECRFYLDTENNFYNGTIYAIELEQHFDLNDYKFLLGILNSNITLFFHKQINPVHLQSKKYRFQSSVMKKYPILMLEKQDKRYQELVRLVDQVILKVVNDKDPTRAEVKINKLVYEIYNLNKHDIEIIEDFLLESQ